MIETILITEPSLGDPHKQHKGEPIFKKYQQLDYFSCLVCLFLQELPATNINREPRNSFVFFFLINRYK